MVEQKRDISMGDRGERPAVRLPLKNFTPPQIPEGTAHIGNLVPGTVERLDRNNEPMAQEDLEFLNGMFKI